MHSWKYPVQDYPAIHTELSPKPLSLSPGVYPAHSRAVDRAEIIKITPNHKKKLFGGVRLGGNTILVGVMWKWENSASYYTTCDTSEFFFFTIFSIYFYKCYVKLTAKAKTKPKKVKCVTMSQHFSTLFCSFCFDTICLLLLLLLSFVCFVCFLRFHRRILLKTLPKLNQEYHSIINTDTNLEKDHKFKPEKKKKNFNQTYLFMWWLNLVCIAFLLSFTTLNFLWLRLPMDNSFLKLFSYWGLGTVKLPHKCQRKFIWAKKYITQHFNLISKLIITNQLIGVSSQKWTKGNCVKEKKFEIMGYNESHVKTLHWCVDLVFVGAINFVSRTHKHVHVRTKSRSGQNVCDKLTPTIPTERKLLYR